MLCMPSTGILMVVALFSTASGAQEREHSERIQANQNDTFEDRSVEAEPVPIIVLGEKEAEKERVVLGSRIAKKPLFDSKTHTVATSTGTPGLAPQSGMDPSGGGIRRITRTSCEASDSEIRADVACALIAAKGAMESGEWTTVRGYLIPLANSDSLSPVEHRAIAEYLYISARTSGIVPNKIEALKMLIDTQTLSDGEMGNALRSLSSLYLAADNKELAISSLKEALRLNPDDQRAIKNLSALKGNGDGARND